MWEKANSKSADINMVILTIILKINEVKIKDKNYRIGKQIKGKNNQTR